MTLIEHEMVAAIARRANRNLGLGKMAVTLDLAYCMEHQALDLEKLFNFPALSFALDIFGIHANLNHKTHKLENWFLPRCAN